MFVHLTNIYPVIYGQWTLCNYFVSILYIDNTGGLRVLLNLRSLQRTTAEILQVILGRQTDSVPTFKAESSCYKLPAMWRNTFTKGRTWSAIESEESWVPGANVGGEGQKTKLWLWKRKPKPVPLDFTAPWQGQAEGTLRWMSSNLHLLDGDDFIWWLLWLPLSGSMFFRQTSDSDSASK
jgi:hypothetical protein